VSRRQVAVAATIVVTLALPAPVSDASSGRVYLNVQGYGLRPVVKYRPDHLNRITGDGTGWRR
jgi:hypothetical protein